MRWSRPRGRRDLTVTSRSQPVRAGQHETLTALFDLGRQVTSVLDVGELLGKLPDLIRRLIPFDAFAVYFLDSKRRTLRIAHAEGYSEEAVKTVRRRVGDGFVGAAVAEEQAMLVNDLTADRHRDAAVPEARSGLVVPLLHKAKVIGALTLLSHEPGQFDDKDLAILRQFGAHVAVALANARMFEREHRDSQTFELLAEIGRDVTSILDLDELLARIAHLVRRIIDYRTFGILLLNERTDELEVKIAVEYGDARAMPSFKLGEGLVGFAALHKQPVLVPDTAADGRYLSHVVDVRSELVVPILLQDKCLGVFDLQSPELDAFDKRYVGVLTLLASQAAVAIENARLYRKVRANESRLRKEVRLAQRVQIGLLPAELPTRPGVEAAARFEPARELGGDFYEVMAPEAPLFVAAVGDVSGKGAAAALYGAFAGELVRSRTFRRRYLPEQSNPATVLASINTILHERQLEGYFCALCYAAFDFDRRAVVVANSGLPFPIRSGADGTHQFGGPGIPLGLFPGSDYDETRLPFAPGDVFVFCTDGIFEATDDAGDEFGAERLIRVVERARDLPARTIVDAIFEAVVGFQGGAQQADDMTAVVLKISMPSGTAASPKA
ncbi:MAG TPA: hypothetical protein DCP38_15715 [Acidobacteria bacterium]|jgi:sigma-B regulation protein RsbU (phosphoserine phosphatase)|nr:GAF domain-containing protein [Vicinamibacterales bacterium]HAK56906.1 hypothetical protein [Acidobacteriota bacterium]|tara:strand:- start:14570 stop:16405 length:1836 start_codon:yes stop_codon:yes gene_type:complete